MSASLVASLLSIVAVVTAASTGLAVHLLGRRAASGKVATSEASELASRLQDTVRQMLLEEKTRAEEQRDKMIDAYTRQVIPVLTSINTLAEDLITLVRVIDANTQPRREGTQPGPGTS